MCTSIKLITLKGITISAHWTFLFLAGGVAAAIAGAGMQPISILWALLFVLAYTASLLAHEYGHALAARRYGIRATHMILFPFGGLASINKIPDRPRHELAISGAGPAASLLLALALALLIHPYEPMWRLQPFTPVVNGSNFLCLLYQLNLMLAVVNLLPAFPLDGGRMLRALLAFRFNYVRATALVTVISRVLALAAIGAGLLLWNLIAVLAGVAILLWAKAEEFYLQLHELVKGIRLNELVQYQYDSLPAGMTVGEAVSLLSNNNGKTFLVMEGAGPVGTLQRMDLIKAVAEMNYQLQVKDLMKKDLVFLEAGSELPEVLERLSGNEEKIYPVRDHERFTGVTSYRHIIEYLLLHKAVTGEYGKVRSLAG
ncbi:site-2 protease family protein [Paraflavisolibacter sp. H34]|uniref:site-2 protease family protein n=1 Tax=Huijunlia imazamoxiresistens TaxID=3127457 RepID=UPI00301932A4